MTEDLYVSIQNSLSNSLWGIVPYIGSLFALILIFSLYAQSLKNLDLSVFKNIIFLFIVALLLGSHNYVPRALDTLIYPAVLVTEKLGQGGYEEKIMLMERKLELVKQKEEEQNNSSLIENIKEFFNSIQLFIESLPASAESFIIYIVQIIFVIAQQVICFLSYFYRIVFAIIFPFSLTISILPIFRDNILNWVKNYLNFSLYIPIANIIGLIVNELGIISLSKDIERLEKNISYNVDSLADNVIYIGMLACGIIAFFFVPSISKWTVNVFIGEYLANKAERAYNKLIDSFSKGGDVNSVDQLFLAECTNSLNQELIMLNEAIRKHSSYTLNDFNKLKETNHEYIGEILKYNDISKLDFQIKALSDLYNEDIDIKETNSSIYEKNRLNHEEILQFFDNIKKLEIIYSEDLLHNNVAFLINQKSNNLYNEVLKHRLYLMHLTIESLKTEEDLTTLTRELRKINNSFDYSKALKNKI